MPDFDYTALSRAGGEIQGREYAETAEALETKLRRRRLILLEAKPRRVARVANATVTQLIAELADLTESEIGVERALQVLSEDRRDPGVSGLADGLRQELKGGVSLSQAFARLGRIDPLIPPMLRVGEATGQLAAMLRRLNEHFERARELRRELQSSLAYPAILLVVSVLSLIGLALYVVPVFRDLFDDSAVELPLGTLIVFAVSDWMVLHGAVAFAITAAASALLLLSVRYVPALRSLIDRAMFAAPLLGEVFALRQASSLTGVLGVLLNGGVPLVQAMQIASETAGNRHVGEIVARAHSEVRQGKPFASAMAQVHVLPNTAQRLMAIGDEAGRLGPACSRASVLMEKSLRARLKALVTLVEPVTILFMGGLVGFVVISMLLAVYGLTDIAG